MCALDLASIKVLTSDVLIEEAIVIALSLFVIVTFEPAVKVATAGPSEPPINNSPAFFIATADKVSVLESCVITTDLSVNEVAFVPPRETGSVPVVILLAAKAGISLATKP